MEALLEEKKLFLFVLLVFPGLVSMVVYRLVLPARPIEWKGAFVQGLFYSIVNFALCSWLLALIDIYGHRYPLSASLAFTVVILVGPILWPILLVRVLGNPWVASRLQLPFPTGWDFFFHQRNPCFVLITLKGGGRVGGFFGPGSYAGSFPDHGDIYLQAVYELTDQGKFGKPVESSRGLWIRKEEYSVVEFFKVPGESSPH